MKKITVVLMTAFLVSSIVSTSAKAESVAVYWEARSCYGDTKRMLLHAVQEAFCEAGFQVYEPNQRSYRKKTEVIDIDVDYIVTIVGAKVTKRKKSGSTLNFPALKICGEVINFSTNPNFRYYIAEIRIKVKEARTQRLIGFGTGTGQHSYISSFRTRIRRGRSGSLYERLISGGNSFGYKSRSYENAKYLAAMQAARDAIGSIHWYK